MIIGKKGRAAAIGGLGLALAVVGGFQLADSPTTKASQTTSQSNPAASLDALQQAAHSLNRPRVSTDVLPPKAATLLSSLPDQVPGAVTESMRVMNVPGLGGLFVAPSANGFAMISTVGFAGTVVTRL
ncbi:MAG: hypothetical protein ACRERD_02630, partial [Candidatus Binatia bacterium]